MPSLYRSNSMFCAAVALAIVTGQVTDRTTGQPMPGVRVAIGSAQTKTGADGTYRLAGVRPGARVVNAFSDDVPPQSFTVTVGKGTVHRSFAVCSITLDYSCAAAH